MGRRAHASRVRPHSRVCECGFLILRLVPLARAMQAGVKFLNSGNRLYRFGIPFLVIWLRS